jgi:6-phosphofructokinase 1
MNACVRAVVRTAISGGHEVVGIRRGYQGLLDEDFFVNVDGQPRMLLRSVSGWIAAGGALLRSSRSDEFRSQAGQAKAAKVLRKHRIDALVAIGGDGTFHGAVELARHWDGQIVGCPGTIDNDLMGSDFTIGFSTAVETAVEAVDKIRDTAESHERMFLVEVMGRHSGYIALYTAIAAAAEVVCVPEMPTDIDAICAYLTLLKQRNKSSVMMVVAEGDEGGGANAIQASLEQIQCPFSTRTVVLGHLQRGGAPTPEDRLLGSQLGLWAVESLAEGKTGIMLGRVGGLQRQTCFAKTYEQHKPLPPELLRLINVLGR